MPSCIFIGFVGLIWSLLTCQMPNSIRIKLQYENQIVREPLSKINEERPIETSWSITIVKLFRSLKNCVS